MLYVEHVFCSHKSPFHPYSHLFHKDTEQQQHLDGWRALEMEKFKAADVDQDQLLNPTEMVSLFNFETSPAVLDVVVQNTLKSKDRNHDGVLSAKEFWEIGAGEQLREQEVADFRKLDKDRINKPQMCKRLMSCDCFSSHVVSSPLTISDQLGPKAMFGRMFSQSKLPAACNLYFCICCTHSFI